MRGAASHPGYFFLIRILNKSAGTVLQASIAGSAVIHFTCIPRTRLRSPRPQSPRILRQASAWTLPLLQPIFGTRSIISLLCHLWLVLQVCHLLLMVLVACSSDGTFVEYGTHTVFFALIYQPNFSTASCLCHYCVYELCQKLYSQLPPIPNLHQCTIKSD